MLHYHVLLQLGYGLESDCDPAIFFQDIIPNHDAQNCGAYIDTFRFQGDIENQVAADRYFRRTDKTQTRPAEVMQFHN